MSATKTLTCMIAMALAAASGAASAGQLDYSVYTGIEHSDNINLVATDPVSQNVFIPGVNFSFLQQGSTIQANLAGNLEYRDYLGSRFDNQTQAELAGMANWTLSPQRLDLTVQEFAGVEPVNSLASNAPGNQQQTNALSVGPTLHFRLGNALRGQAELRYMDSYAQKTKEFNSHRGQAALRLIRDTSPTSQLSANAEVQHVDFYDSIDDPNYDRTELYAHYVDKLTHFDIDGALGWTQLNFDKADTPNASGPLVRATLNWRPTQRSTFGVTAAREYSDAAQDMLLDLDETPMVTDTRISTGNAVINSQVYMERSLQVAYSFRTERITLSLAPFYRKLSYVNDPTYDQSIRGGSISLGYRLRPTLTLSLRADDETIKYHVLDRRDETTEYGIDLVDDWTSHWSGRASLLHQRRDSSEPGQGFRENEIYLGVIFTR